MQLLNVNRYYDIIMRNRLIFLFLSLFFCSTNAWAQVDSGAAAPHPRVIRADTSGFSRDDFMYARTPEEVRRNADRLVSLGKRDYVFERVHEYHKQYASGWLYYVAYREVSGLKRELRVYYKKVYDIVENNPEETEIVFRFEKIRGPFYDIFPTWLVYLDADADADAIIKRKYKEIMLHIDGIDVKFYLNSHPEYWMLSTYWKL